MHRRRFLALASGALVGLGGCTSSDTRPVDTTSEPTETENGVIDRLAGNDSGGSTDEDSPDIVVTSHELVTTDDTYRQSAAVLALMENVGPTPSGGIRVTARFFDEDDNPLDVATEYLIGLNPGETWKAYIPYYDDGVNVASHDLEAAFQVEPLPRVPEGIELLDSQLDTEDSEAVKAELTGRLRNVGEEPFEYLKAEAKFYADETTVLTSNYASTTNLETEDEWSFTVTYLPYDEEWASPITDYELHVVDSPY
ncbi:FxLYD domain-containing protein [Haloprofundus halophilus]|uniref:FxLYD domain-containing protein n=1 Tax=Haloprofundus halophilus TaxID=2283527 RepID=UPI000E446BFC|nr:FxLYD domain-containing protein [Haloprofundus halophilus]